jgi:hypothetical protein
MFRILHFSDITGSRETVVITLDMDVDASEFCPYGQTLDRDLKCDVISGGNIDGLPLDYELHRI